MGTIVAPNEGTARLRIDRDPRRELPQLVDRTTIAIESLRTQWRTVADLGTHERMAVSQLRVYGPMPMSELAARISLSRAAVTSLIDRLEEDGWVRREPDEHDRRRTVLRLMPRAADEFESLSNTFWTNLVDRANQLPDDQWNVVQRFLEDMCSEAERQTRELRASAAERSLS